jgi:hypothetical protein
MTQTPNLWHFFLGRWWTLAGDPEDDMGREAPMRTMAKQIEQALTERPARNIGGLGRYQIDAIFYAR